VLDIDLSSGFSSFIGTFIPAYWAGYTWHNKTGAVPESGKAWQLSFYFTIIQLTFAFVLIMLLGSFIPEISKLTSGVGLGILIGALIFFGIIILLITRWFFLMAAKQQAKVATR